MAEAIEVVDEALRLVGVDSRRSEALARRGVELARRDRDVACEARAERALGLAGLQRGSTDALRHLRRAVTLAHRAQAPALESEARLTLAFNLAARGAARAAQRELDRADQLAAPSARAMVQQGLVLYTLGRFAEAVEVLGAALRPLRRADDGEWVLAALINRGAAHLSRADVAAAEADLREAVDLANSRGDVVDAAFAEANLGYAFALHGKVPDALAAFASAEQRLRATGTSVAALLSMRAELLLSVRLVGEAREAATAALAEFVSEGNAVSTAETRLLLAQVCVREGQLAQAAAHARTARRAFTRQGRPAMAALATAWLAGSGTRVPAAEVEAAVEAVAAAGWHVAEIEVRILAHRLGRRSGTAGLEHLAAASRWRSGRRPADVRARAWYAEAVLRAQTGRPTAAQRAAVRGLAILDEHRASLPATDIRAHAAAHRTDLARLGLRLALSGPAPRRVLVWAERGRATGLLQAPARPPTAPGMAALMAPLRQVVQEMYECRANGSPPEVIERLRSRQVRLERQIRDLARASGDQDQVDPVGRPADLRELGAALGDRALVEYVALDGALHAVTLVDGRCRLHHLGPTAAVAGLLDRVPFAVQRMIRAASRPAGAAAATLLLRDAGRRLDEILLAVLPETAGRDLVLVPTGLLQALPWSVLPSCHGRPVTVAPSATVWLAAMSRSTGPGHVVVAAGPRLPNAHAEAKAVAALYGTDPVVGADARVETVMAALAGAGAAHLATHGRLSAQNPLFSHLLLADGPLVVYDLERLSRLPHTVVLAACDSGRHVVRAGDELLGLSAAFLARGTAQLVASVVPVPDAETAELMTTLHTGLVEGLGPAVALARAQAALAGAGPVAAATAAGFVCLGAGYLPVPLAPLPAPVPDLVDLRDPVAHQPRSRQAGSDPRSAPSVVSLP